VKRRISGSKKRWKLSESARRILRKNLYGLQEEVGRK
jgi:hypothetical protein